MRNTKFIHKAIATIKWIRVHLSLSAVYAILITVLMIILLSGYWNKPNKVITNDVQEYYSYLPAAVIFHDLTTRDIPPDYRGKYIWSLKSPTGKRVFKFTMGMSFLYAPFFGVAHFYTILTGQEALGVSPPYKFMLIISGYFYLILGLFFLRKVLKKFYRDEIVALTLISVVIGTNLLYYSSIRVTMTHVYTFGLFSMFMWETIKWFETPKIKTAVLIGLLTGIISLVRPSNALIVLFFVMYGLKKKRDISTRIKLFLKEYRQILIIIIFALLVWVPQMIYWKIQTGQFLYYSYKSDEGFFFTNPQILNSLFSYHNGWLLYTPIMIFALAGIVVLYFKRREFFWPIMIITLLNIYILSSWWCWWFLGFGNRSYVESYALLAIPFAEILTVIYQSRLKLLKGVISLILAFFIFLNSFQVWQYSHYFMHHDSMTKEMYWYIFLKTHPDGKRFKMQKKPDYKKAKQGIYEFIPE